MNTEELYRIYQSHPFVTTDTRNCTQGSIFFALKGENFDGNIFVEEALEKGCSYVVCDNPGSLHDERIIKVNDSLKSLQELANYHRRQLKIPLIAITGTNGKTTTKELIAAVLSSRYKVLFTQGNLNNHIGVPLTLLQLKPSHELAIIEMGANHQEEIKQLSMIAEPDFGLITNIGKAHLEGFGSFEGVIKAKGELYDYIRKSGGKVFVNHENPILMKLAIGMDAIYYGQTSESSVWGEEIAEPPFLTFLWRHESHSHKVKTQLIGSYNLENALAAITVGSYFDVDASLICKAIEDYSPQNNRSQFKETGKNKLIIDAYNANPTSMMAALENFNKMEITPKALILGDMQELGTYSQSEHQRIIDFLAVHEFEKVLLCGINFFSLSLNKSNYLKFETIGDLNTYLETVQLEGFYILIKGSRGNQLEKTIEFL